jgi:hypothetical protein
LLLDSMAADATRGGPRFNQEVSMAHSPSAQEPLQSSVDQTNPTDDETPPSEEDQDEEEQEEDDEGTIVR